MMRLMHQYTVTTESGAEEKWSEIRSAEDVTDEILHIAESTYDDWFADDDRVDWEEFVDRMDGTHLQDDTRLSMGNQMDSPAITMIKKHVREYRRNA